MVSVRQLLIILNVRQQGVQETFGQLQGQLRQTASGMIQMRRTSTQNKEALKRLFIGTKAATGATKRFKFEFLGLLFFGQALTRMFGRFTTNSFEASGSTSIWTAALNEASRKGLEPLTDSTRDAGLEVLGAGENTQVWIGRLLFLGDSIGRVFNFVGQLALGMLSLEIIMSKFPKTASLITKVFGFLVLAKFKVIKAAKFLFKTFGVLFKFLKGPIIRIFLLLVGILSVKVLLIIGAVILAVVLLKKAWDTNLFGIQDRVKGFVSFLKTGFSSLMVVLQPVFRFLKKLFDIAVGVIGKASGITRAFNLGGLISRFAPDVGGGGGGKQTNINAPTTINIRGNADRRTTDEIDRNMRNLFRRGRVTNSV